MTVSEAITRADILRGGNNCSEEQKLQWLSALDQQINEQLFKRHENCLVYRPEQLEYDAESEAVTDLKADRLFEAMYVHWLCAQIDFANGDIARYNNERILFESWYQKLADFINSRYLPKKDAAQIRRAGWGE